MWAIYKKQWKKSDLERLKIKYWAKYKDKQNESKDHNNVEYKPENSQWDRQRNRQRQRIHGTNIKLIAR